jgi:hypothetical protein
MLLFAVIVLPFLLRLNTGVKEQVGCYIVAVDWFNYDSQTLALLFD